MSKHLYKSPSNRSFGLLLTTVLIIAIVASYPASKTLTVFFAALAVLSLICSLIMPNLFALPNQTWNRFGTLMQKIVNPIILGVIFFFIICPIALLIRIFAKRPLDLQLKQNHDSYWIDRTTQVSQLSMKQQF
ncbi:SxtJ family membrane protein [Oleiphilus messinensis]|uniref:SxtJ family membrane protein n=1 Tax=Oleiphilus messinensis TaxID=141451 RepID=UPI000B3B1AFA